MEMLRARGIPNGVVKAPNLSANNLLQKFIITRDSEYGENREEDKDIELTLGLSLNGQFGTDPRSRKRKNFELGRSSSIPEGFVFDKQIAGGVYGGDMRQTVGRGVSNIFHLDRTRSLPVKTETEKKRKRSEKTKEKNRVQAETDKAAAFIAFNVPPSTKKKEENDRFLVPCTVNGIVITGKNKKNQEDCGMEKARNILEDMPCVSTRDVGADGKRVEGFLYWYGGNKEEVKIVCVCHGSFLSPAEFVRHGGGGDVTVNPLRHIVVKLPSSSL